MSSAPTANPKPHETSVLAAFLSYLIPGLGQIYQGRFGKGFLFMVALLGMFFLGQAMGNWQNVHMPTGEEQGPVGRGRGAVASLVTRWHYNGQFWIGMAAWPAILQFYDVPLPGPLKDYQKTPTEAEINHFLVNSDKTPDLGWVYTVIAGMLNILVIYDAYAGPMFAPALKPTSRPTTEQQAEAKKEGVA
jgi:Family of unknown function (DUF6677)